MTSYAVYATRFDDPHVVEELIPARELSFSMPLSDHGECSFTATVEPGRSLWRAALTPPLSGILITRDGVPVWSGWLTTDRETGPRTFQFTAKEWGSIFSKFPARVFDYSGWTTQRVFRDIVTSAQSVSGQATSIDAGSWSGGATLDEFMVEEWDNVSAETIFKQIAEAEGGPEWYFGTSGTLANPKRTLVLGDRLGETAPVDTLQFVEDTEDWSRPDGPPGVALLGDLFPAGTVSNGALGRRGGNVLAKARTRDTARSATVAVAVGDGTDAAQIRATATASRLISTVGWPRLTTWEQHSGVVDDDILQRHANADLGAVAGIATGYSLVSFDGDPDWTQVPRGSTMQVILDTDIYAGPRPLQFNSRVLSTTVDVPDDGGSAQVTWETADVLEVS